MKSLLTILALILLLNSALFSKNDMNPTESTIQSLMIGLESENIGLKTGCAYMLGELKVTEAVIPLMKLLRNDEQEEVRISAALALYKIGTPMSIYAVKQASKYDDSKRVLKLASNFYNEYLRNNISHDEQSKDTTNVALK